MVWVLEKVYDCDSAEVLAVYNKLDLQDATIEAKKDLGVQVKEEIMFWKENYGRRGFKNAMELAQAEILGPLRDEDEIDEDPPEDWFDFVQNNNQYFFSIGPLVLHLQYYRYYESDKLKIKEV